MEASHLIDLKKLVGETPANLLAFRTSKKSVLKRFPDNLMIVFFILGLIGFLSDWYKDGMTFGFRLLIPPVLIILYMRKIRIRGEYFVASDGLTVPYTWLTRKLIPFAEIVRFEMGEEKNDQTGIDQRFLEIVLDTKKIKYNTTGLTEPRIILTDNDYEFDQIQSFYSELQTFHRNAGETLNTQAERLSAQVTSAWKYRWNLIVLRFLDSTSEFALYLYLTYLTTLLFPFGISALLFIIFGIYCALVFLFLFFDRPASIIGMRPHELGSIFYNEADLVTTIRFIAISYPKGIKLINCELFFADDPLPQKYKLEELHPKETEPGTLTYGVAQYIGNHSKAIGASVGFSYVGEEIEYIIPIYWA